jgi:hypothetical protein
VRIYERGDIMMALAAKIDVESYEICRDSDKCVVDLITHQALSVDVYTYGTELVVYIRMLHFFIG